MVNPISIEHPFSNLVMKNQLISVLGGLLLLQVATPATGEILPNQSLVAIERQSELMSKRRHSSLDNLRRLALNLVNRDRRQQGVPKLTDNPLLNEVAQSHAEDMIRRRYLSHYAKDGSAPEDRVRSAGGKMSAGENILSYHLGPQKQSRGALVSEFQTLFFNSSRHRQTMLRSRYSQIGYGFAAAPDGRIVAVQLFGVPDDH